MDSERQYLEGLLNTRFNYTLVFSSLFLVAIFQENLDGRYRTAALIAATVVSTISSFSVTRTRRLVEAALKKLRGRSEHPHKITYDIAEGSGKFFKRSANVYSEWTTWATTAFFGFLLLISLCENICWCQCGASNK